MEFINRIRKKALTDEELAQALAWEAAQKGQTPDENTKAMTERLRSVMDEAIPLMNDVESFDWNLRKLREQFNVRGFVVSGKILETKTVNLKECDEHEYQGQKVSYPKEIVGEAPADAEVATLNKFQINVHTPDGVVQLDCIPPNYPRNPNDKSEGQQAQ